MIIKGISGSKLKLVVRIPDTAARVIKLILQFIKMYWYYLSHAFSAVDHSANRPEIWSIWENNYTPIGRVYSTKNTVWANNKYYEYIYR